MSTILNCDIGVVLITRLGAILTVGADEGALETVGDIDGSWVGCLEGVVLGIIEGFSVGSIDGINVGMSEGFCDGESVGCELG